MLLLLINIMSSVCSLQMFPGDVGVSGGSGPRGGSAEGQDVGSKRGQPLGAKLGVDEIQMCSHNHHSRVGCSGLQGPQHTGADMFIERVLKEKKKITYKKKYTDLICKLYRTVFFLSRLSWRWLGCYHEALVT